MSQMRANQAAEIPFQMVSGDLATY